MALAKLYSRALCGMRAPEVIVEVHVANGLPGFSIVGLADTEVRESRDRVRSAIQMSGFNFPARRITVNLAPADLPKESGRYDLPIALGILIASGLIKPELDISQFEFAGEMALDGMLRDTHGVLAIVANAKDGLRKFILPPGNADEVSLVEGVTIYKAAHISDVIKFLCNEAALEKVENSADNVLLKYTLDFSQVKGQTGVKSALEVAAAGRHSALMIGNPGCGKSMLAHRFVTILPQLTTKESLESASIYSLVNNGFDTSKWAQIPFRQPHHTSSGVAIVGGGANPKPGEISLAHNGVLFLDEMPEFDKRVLEVLREPLETKKINIARANNKVEFPADFQLIGAMNPCPCGNFGHINNMCKCSVEQIERYKGKLSAPLLDRVDLMIQLPHILPEELQSLPNGESSSIIRDRVIKARDIQLKRQNKLNYALDNTEVDEHCKLTEKALGLAKQATIRFGLSARAYYRLLKVGRTVADLSGSDIIDVPHIAQSIQYKNKG